jgi:hypothetical protein
MKQNLIAMLIGPDWWSGPAPYTLKVERVH